MQQSVTAKTSVFFVKREGRRWRSGHRQGRKMWFSGRKVHVLHCKRAHIALQNMAFHTAICRILQCKMPCFSFRNAVFRCKKELFHCTNTALTHNYLILHTLSLHTFPCRFYGLRDFYLQTPPYFGVMGNQEESVMVKTVTRWKRVAYLFKCNLSSLRFICIIFA